MTREEIFVGVAGEALATLAGVRHQVGQGDALVVPPGVDFSITAAGPESFRALVCFPVGGQAVMGDGEPFTPPWAV